MNRTNTEDILKKEIDSRLDKIILNNDTTRDELIEDIANTFGVSKVLVNRVARKLKTDYENRVKILQYEPN